MGSTSSVSRGQRLETDVLVAGCGIAGTFAAIAAGRAGVRVTAVDRFGMVGGNMGPGYMQGGSLTYFGQIVNGPPDLVREFHKRLAEHRAPADTSWERERDVLPDIGREMMKQGITAWDQEPGIASYVASVMMRDAGVTPILSAYVADPIVEDGVVKGAFVETVSGRVEIRAAVTIDATGEAAIAARAGCPMLRPGDERSPAVLAAIERIKADYPAFGGAELAKLMGTPSMGGYVLVAGIDTPAYEAHIAEVGKPCATTERDFSRRMVQIESVGEIEFQLNQGKQSSDGVAGLRLEIKKVPDAGDAWTLSQLEFHARMFCFETVRLMRQHVPGCARAYLVFVSPFLGCRGGTCIEGEYSLTAEDMEVNRRFDDTIFISQLVCDDGRSVEQHNCDVPYRILLPKGVDGLLCVGRSASHRRLLRTRPGCMLQGITAGTAAAIALKTGKTPKTIDRKELQRRLLGQGFYLGEQRGAGLA